MANRYEKTLALLLRLDAILLLAAVVPSMMPFAWMQAIHRSLGMGELSGGPLNGYLTRSLSMLYALHGAVMLFLSLDVAGSCRSSVSSSCWECCSGSG